MKSYTDSEIYHGILERNPEVISFIYKNYLPIFLKDMNSSGQLYGDAEDIFQETLIIVYQNIQNKKIDQETNFKSYFWSVFRNLSHNQKRKYHSNKVNLDVENHNFADEELDRQYEKNLRSKIYIEHFNRLKEECKRLLQLFFQKLGIKEIASKLGYKNEKVVKVKKYKCKEELVQNIKKDHRFNDTFE